jgi:hypothetical protein
MKWIKGHTSELDSTLYQEADIEIRYVFYALRLLAGRENKGGKIKYLNNAHLARLINTTPEIIERSLKFLEKTKRVKIQQISEGYILKISKWNIYQGDTRSKTESQNTQKDGKMESQTHAQSRIVVDEISTKSTTKSEDAETTPHFDTRFEFLKRLRILEEDIGVEHDDDKNKQLFEYLLNNHRGLDPIRELDSIIALWKKSPDKLGQRLKDGISLHEQLYKLFNEAAKYAGVK